MTSLFSPFRMSTIFPGVSGAQWLIDLVSLTAVCALATGAVGFVVFLTLTLL